MSGLPRLLAELEPPSPSPRAAADGLCGCRQLMVAYRNVRVESGDACRNWIDGRASAAESIAEGARTHLYTNNAAGRHPERSCRRTDDAASRRRRLLCSPPRRRQAELAASPSIPVESAADHPVSPAFLFAVANGFGRASLAALLWSAACNSSISNRLTSLKSVEIVVCIQMKFERERPAGCNDNDRQRAIMGE